MEFKPIFAYFSPSKTSKSHQHTKTASNNFEVLLTSTTPPIGFCNQFLIGSKYVSVPALERFVPHGELNVTHGVIRGGK
jgi:hypothetical protein